MRKRILRASATLALLSTLAVAACASSAAPAAQASPGSACVNASAKHRAYVVAEHLTGSSLTKCVGFAGATINGADLMKQSGIEYSTQVFSFGTAVCQIDKEPAQFSQCLPQGAPYWGLWVAPKGGPFTEAQTGFDAVAVPDGGSLGWVYTPQTASPAPPPLPKV